MTFLTNRLNLDRVVKVYLFGVLLIPLVVSLYAVRRQLVRSNAHYNPVTDFLPDSTLLLPVLCLSALGFIGLWVVFLSANNRLRADGFCARTFPRFFGAQPIIFISVCPAMMASMYLVWSWILELVFHGIGSRYAPRKTDVELLSQALAFSAAFSIFMFLVVLFAKVRGRADPFAVYYGGAAVLRASIHDSGQTWNLHLSSGTAPAKGLGSQHLGLLKLLVGELNRLGPHGPKRIIMDSHLLANGLSPRVSDRFERFLMDRGLFVESKSTEQLTFFQTWIRSKKDLKLKGSLAKREKVHSSRVVFVSGIGEK